MIVQDNENDENSYEAQDCKQDFSVQSPSFLGTCMSIVSSPLTVMYLVVACVMLWMYAMAMVYRILVCCGYFFHLVFNIDIIGLVMMHISF